MNQDNKIKCYRKAYQYLKENKRVENLTYPENKKNLEFTCQIDDIDVEYNLRLALDFLTIRASKHYPGEPDSRLTEIGQNLIAGQTCKFTAYNETLIFQLSLPLVGIADEDAKRFVNDETKKFFQFVFSLNGEATSEDTAITEEMEVESNAMEESNQTRVFPTPTAKTQSSVSSIEMETAAGVMSEIQNQSDILEEQEIRRNQLEWIVEKREDVLKQEKKLSEWERVLKEKEEKFKARVEAFDNHTDEIKSKIKELSEMEEVLKKKNAEINEREQSLVAQDTKIVERSKQLKAVKKIIIEREKTVTEQEAQLTKKLAELEVKEEELNKAKQSISETEQCWAERSQQWKKEREELLSQNEIFQKQIGVLQEEKIKSETIHQEQISSLQIEIEEYKKNGKDFGTPDEVLIDFADTRRENRKLKREIEDIRSEAEINEKALLEKISAIQVAQAKREEKEAAQEAANTPEARAYAMIMELQTSGLMFTIINKNDYVLECKRDGCLLQINVIKQILLAKKNVVKGARYQEQIRLWNQEDITEAYFFDRKSVMCKKVITDATIDVNKVLRKFLPLK